MKTWMPFSAPPRAEDALRGEGRPLQPVDDIRARFSSVLVYMAASDGPLFQRLLVGISAS